MARCGIPKILRAEVSVAGPDPERLNASGVLIVNPPWMLERQLTALLPALASILARGSDCGAKLDWVAGEK